MDSSVAKSLYLYAKGKDARIAELEQSQADTFKSILAKKGSQVVSTATNGTSVTYSTKGMTNQEWFDTVSQALLWITNGYNKPSKKIGLIA